MAALLLWTGQGRAQLPDKIPDSSDILLLPPLAVSGGGAREPEKLPPPALPEGKDEKPAASEPSGGSPPRAFADFDKAFTWNPPGPDFWQKNPPYRLIPRLGNLPVLPGLGEALGPQSGTGYYSLLDLVRGTERPAPPKFPYPRFGVMVFGYFDCDFRYLDNPNNQEFDWSDRLHRIHLGDNWLFNTGGEVRSLYMDMPNFNLAGKYDHKDLFRTRIYGDLWFRDIFRVYVEFMDAQSWGHILPPAVTDVDHGDLLNAFVDVKLFDLYDRPAYVRVGRQQIYLGSQRLIGQLDWVNTNRTFDGVRGFRQGEKFDFDMFWAQPVIPNPTKFDWVDPKQNLTGLWTEFRPQKGHYINIYDLFLSNLNPTAKLGITSGPFDVNTLGSRYLGEKGSFLWDFEGMFQLGSQGGTHNIIAGAATTGLGWHWKERPWNPTLWGYFDFASGDPNPNKHGSFNTFNQLFPFGHYYLGWTDLVGRQNLLDPNLQFFLYPTKWITIWQQYHHFWLASPKDALYNAGGVAILRDPTGKSGSNVGDEYDFIINFTLSKHANLLVTYAELFGGNFVRANSKHPNAETTYIMYVYRW